MSQSSCFIEFLWSKLTKQKHIDDVKWMLERHALNFGQSRVGKEGKTKKQEWNKAEKEETFAPCWHPPFSQQDMSLLLRKLIGVQGVGLPTHGCDGKGCDMHRDRHGVHELALTILDTDDVSNQAVVILDKLYIVLTVFVEKAQDFVPIVSQLHVRGCFV